MFFAQYYHMSKDFSGIIGEPERLMPARGKTGFKYILGRLTKDEYVAKAREHAKKLGPEVVGFTIEQGINFLDSKTVVAYQEL